MAASLAADVPLFIASPTSAWASGGRVVRAVAGHRQQVALGLLLADERDLLLGRRLRDEVVDAGFLGDRRRGPRVVAGDHDRPDAHLAELGEALDEPFLDRVLELDHAKDPALGLEDERGGAHVGDAVGLGHDVGRQAADLRVDGVDRSLEDRRPGGRPDAARARLGAERDLFGDGRAERREGGVVADAGRATELGQPLADELDDRAALGRLVPDRGDQRGVEDLRLGDARRRRDGGGEPVAVGDRAGLVEQDDVDVPGRLDGTTAHGQDVEARDAVHAGDADRGQQAADRRRDEAHEQGDRATVSTVVPAYWPNGRRVTVAIRKMMVRPASRIASAISFGVRWRLAPSTRAIIRSRKVSPGSVVTRITRRSLTSVVPPVTELRMSVPGLLEDRRRLAGDRRLVDEADALDDVAVTGDRLALLDDDDVALAQLGRADVLERAVGRCDGARSSPSASGAASRPGRDRAPRRPPRRRSRTGR